MSQKFQGKMLRTGTRLQAGIPKRRPRINPGDATGMLLRGVVTATYVLDDPHHPFSDKQTVVPTAVYCDVLTFGRQWRFIPQCLVSQDRSGLHSGRIWKPRATTMTLTGDPVDLNKGTNPANIDGDHVLVGFLDGNAGQPVILRWLPHPAADVGNEEFETGHRLKLIVDDGDPDFMKHNGTYYGINAAGDFQVDTTHANDGKLLDTDGEWGHEALPPTDGKGSVRMDLPQDAVVMTRLLDMSDPLNPKAVLMKEVTKDNTEYIHLEDHVYEVILADLTDPENPNTKTTLRITKDFLELELQDGTKRLIVQPNLIELGAEGASDKAVLDSLLQGELGSIATAIGDLVSDFNDHTHPLPEYIVPMIPLDIQATTASTEVENDEVILTLGKQSLVSYNKAGTASALVTIDS